MISWQVCREQKGKNTEFTRNGWSAEKTKNKPKTKQKLKTHRQWLQLAFRCFQLFVCYNFVLSDASPSVTDTSSSHRTDSAHYLPSTLNVLTVLKTITLDHEDTSKTDTHRLQITNFHKNTNFPLHSPKTGRLNVFNVKQHDTHLEEIPYMYLMWHNRQIM